MGISADTLLEQAVRGDPEALRVLLKQYGPVVRERLAGKIGRQWRSVLAVEDVMQVTYFEAFHQIDQLTVREPRSFTAWLTRIAENNLRDAIHVLERSKRPPPTRRVHTPPGDDSYVALLELLGSDTTTPSRKAAAHEVVEIVNTALSRLPADYERVVRLYDLQGRPAEEVAAAMGRSVGAVYMLRHRGHVRLREELGSASRFFSDTP